MTQPLEQFVSNYYLFLDLGLDYVSMMAIFVNKYLLAVGFVLFMCFFFLFVIKNDNKSSFVLYGQYYYNKIMMEMINVVSFNFIFFSLLYFCTFVYIYLFNLIGLLPNTPCFTTQIFANLMLSFTLIIGITMMNIDKNGMLFFQLFIPKGVPKFLIPFLFILEFFSYFIRILSLSIRLFSNMVAGHSLLHILFDMITNVKILLETKLDILLFLFFFLLLVIFIIFVFEFIVAFLQAYVFAIMFTIYLNDLTLNH